MRLHDFFDYFAREQPDAPYLEFEGRELTWNDAAREVNRLANAMVRSGVEPGQRHCARS
ncbi:AMP-binding protein [Mycolicibacterium confluentis]|uniref:AMP-dependent synthetase/ligase domain-containing protein n=1 Tax=Mycolicibacterium confluentis TaxID=28047 RepID=A0A7I7XXT6_9MYCO|nr:AMP-binding protein [Mycolicibacterium confluentis]MCV7322498.1 AMP-binding protein [Mycolicibacterium confluentis]BBZ34087.1 hypothetical protein MCNF_26920 [Mycolicibacterium confluentis]